MVEIPKVTFSLLLTGRGKKTEKYKIKTNMPWWMSTRQDKKGKKASNSLLELSISPLGNPLRWHLSLFFIATYTFVHKCVQISLSRFSISFSVCAFLRCCPFSFSSVKQSFPYIITSHSTCFIKLSLLLSRVAFSLSSEFDYHCCTVDQVDNEPAAVEEFNLSLSISVESEPSIQVLWTSSCRFVCRP